MNMQDLASNPGTLPVPTDRRHGYFLPSRGQPAAKHSGAKMEPTTICQPADPQPLLSRTITAPQAFTQTFKFLRTLSTLSILLTATLILSLQPTSHPCLPIHAMLLLSPLPLQVKTPPLNLLLPPTPPPRPALLFQPLTWLNLTRKLFNPSTLAAWSGHLLEMANQPSLTKFCPSPSQTVPGVSGRVPETRLCASSRSQWDQLSKPCSICSFESNQMAEFW